MICCPEIGLIMRPQTFAPRSQDIAAIRMLFSWLKEKGVLAMNLAREVKTEKFSRTQGKPPAFVEGKVQKLLNAVQASTHVGLRDRALLGVLAYTFALEAAQRIAGHAVSRTTKLYDRRGKKYSLKI
jgi:site-specific recombinase XerC